MSLSTFWTDLFPKIPRFSSKIQRKIDETYEGFDVVAAIVDDILVFGKTKEELAHCANEDP